MNISPELTHNPRRPRIAAAPTVATVKETPAHTPHVITVTSGKGGVGKTNLSVNLGYMLRQMRRRVLLLDADLGLANVDVLLGLRAEHNLSHVLTGEKKIEDILLKAAGGLQVLPASSGQAGMTDLSDANKVALLGALESLEKQFDFIIIDSGAGISSNVIYFNLAAQTMVVVVTPEPTSLTDAYAVIKVLSGTYHQRRFKVLANDVASQAEGLEVFDKLTRVTDRFLSVSLDYIGCVPHDKSLREAVRMQRPFSEVFPDQPAAQAVRKIAREISNWENDPLNGDLGLLWRNMLGPAQAFG